MEVSRGTLGQRRHGLVLASLATAILGGLVTLAGAILAIVIRNPIGWLAPVGFIASMGGVTYATNRWRIEKTGGLRADERGLWLGHLARGGRATKAWLRDLGVRDDAYRTADAPPDELWRVVADPALPATARAAEGDELEAAYDLLQDEPAPRARAR